MMKRGGKKEGKRNGTRGDLRPISIPDSGGDRSPCLLSLSRAVKLASTRSGSRHSYTEFHGLLV